MSVHLEVHSVPIIIDKTCKNGKFIMDPYELGFLWVIVNNKAMSYYELSHEEVTFPKSRAMSTITVGNTEAYLSKMKESKTRHYPFVRKVVKRLEEKGLVSVKKDSSGDRSKRIVSPTFKGMIYYLQNESPNEEQSWKQIKKSLGNHKEVMSPLLDSKAPIEDYINDPLFFNAFYKTVWEFKRLRKVRVTIRHLGMTFEGYMEDPASTFAYRIQYLNRGFQKNLNLFDYLSKSEGVEAKNAYISYLAMNDIELLSLSKKNLRHYNFLLISERELAQFEKRQACDDNFLFDGERPKEFFPKYCSLQFFFVGMWFRNLGWGPISKEGQKECVETENISDYQFEEIY
jgi:hypothetical protein